MPKKFLFRCYILLDNIFYFIRFFENTLALDCFNQVAIDVFHKFI